MIIHFLFLLILTSFNVSANNAATTILLDHSTEHLDPSHQLRFFEDKNSELDANTAFLLDKQAWQALPDDLANFGFSNSTYWFSLNLRNTDTIDLELYLHINYALLDHIKLFVVNKSSPDQTLSTTQLHHTGDTFEFNARPAPFPTFLLPLELKAGEENTYLLQVSSQGSMQVPLSIWQKEAFLIKSNSDSFLYGFFLSALLIMSAYNLCLFLVIRDKTYLLYSSFIFCMAGVHSSLDGYAFQWFWPNAVAWHQISAIGFISIGLLVTVFFTRSILPIPANSYIDKGIKALAVLTTLSALTSIFLPYQKAATLNAIMTVIVMSGVAMICVAMLRHSPRIARFFCIAWGAYFLGIVLKSASKIGYLPYSTFTEYAGNIGGVVGIVIIAMALADRINNERRARASAQEQSIDNLKRFEALYQNALEGIFTYNAQGILLSANPAFLSLIGLKNIDNFNGNLASLEGYYLPEKQFLELFRAVKSEGQVSEYEAQMSNAQGDSIWVNISARLSNENGEEQIEGTLININERKVFEEQLKHMAEHDPLTGFYNRRAFEFEAKELLIKVQNYEDTACLLYMDLDQFKIVNDLCGHSAGDLLLQNISQKLLTEVQALEHQQIIARLGGDEFGILLKSTSLPKARLIAEALREAVEKFLFVWDNKRYSIGVSIGLVEICPFHQSVEQILAMADSACYLAKDQGRNRVHVFVETDKDMQFRQLEMQWVSSIKEALEQDQFFLVFQHIGSNANHSNRYHYEILLRLINSQGNLCAPGQFLPAAERYNLMPNIDRWVIRHFFSWLHKHPEHMEQLDCASINLSTQSIGHEDFSSFLVHIFDEFKIPPSKICFEITEGMAITHLDNTQHFIKKFRSLGCRFALDDFGTGFSSYAYLRDLHIDFLKIDGMFIKNLVEDGVNTAMVKSIADVASAIGIETIAEFVETEKIKQKLTEIGISYSQGYHIHKPQKLESTAFIEFNSNAEEAEGNKNS